MNVAQDLSLLSLITGASLPVQGVMMILLLSSLVSWWYIFLKLMMLSGAAAEAESFEQAFWHGGDLGKLYETVTAGRRSTQGLASIFEAGYKEFARLKKQGVTETSDLTEAARRAMRAAYIMHNRHAYIPHRHALWAHTTSIIGNRQQTWGRASGGPERQRLPTAPTSSQ